MLVEWSPLHLLQKQKPPVGRASHLLQQVSRDIASPDGRPAGTLAAAASNQPLLQLAPYPPCSLTSHTFRHTSRDS